MPTLSFSENEMDDDVSAIVNPAGLVVLMENRGSGSVPKKVHELIEYYCYHEGKPQPQGNGASWRNENG